MSIVEIIEKKRDGGILSDEEISFFIDGYCNGDIPEYQASALLMAIFFRGMDDHELATLTSKMVETGDVLDFSNLDGIFVDKHSTGGVGDKTSIALTPILAALGLKVAKMSGRGLGHTGGTVDKLESIPGYRTEETEEEFLNQVKKIGIALIGQSSNMVYADKKMYALRDVTATVDSIPLIASSIMSKKIAAGANIILLDVKYGDGAFMKTKENAVKLAERMKAIGEHLGRKILIEITSMNDVLGTMVGNALEVKEAIDTLKGDADKDFYEICVHSATSLLHASGLAETKEEAKAKVDEVIKSGAALNKLGELIEAQGGDKRVLEDESLLKISPYIYDVRSDRSGYIGKVRVKDVGLLSSRMGAGRFELDDVIDPGVGLKVYKKHGDKVEKGEVLATLYHKKDEDVEKRAKELLECYDIVDEKPEVEPLIYKAF